MNRRLFALLAAAVALTGAVAAMSLWLGTREVVCSDKSSAFQLYCGYDDGQYDGYLRTSQYVDLPDGSRIAVDILRPTLDGAVVTEPLPVLFSHTVYNRAASLVRDYKVADAKLMRVGRIARLGLWATSLFSGGTVTVDQGRAGSWVNTLIRRGYVVVAADARGTGASFGTPHKTAEGYGREASALIDWIVSEPWSNGRIGMYGQSFVAMTAYAAAAEGHPALKAIFVSAPPFDPYRDVGYPGGIYAKGFGENYVALTSDLDAIASPVAEDADGVLLSAALIERQGQSFSAQVADLFRTAPYLDSLSRQSGSGWYDIAGFSILTRVNAANVAVYNIGGWRDIFARDTILWHENLETPKRLVMRPWHHRLLMARQDDFDPAPEAARWFDYWLKDIPNGIEKEQVVRFFQTRNGGQGAWCEADAWPAGDETLLLYPGEDGALRRGPDKAGRTVNVAALSEATTGVNSRWNGVLGTGEYDNYARNSTFGASFVTPVLENPLEIAGHPILRVGIKAAQPGAAVFAYLEEMDANGAIHYLTEGMLRPEFRAPATAPYRNVGLPFHDYGEAAQDVAPPGETVDLVFDMLPVAAMLPEGSRLRLTFRAGDTDNFAPAPGGPQPFVVDLGSTSITVPVASCRALDG